MCFVYGKLTLQYGVTAVEKPACKSSIVTEPSVSVWCSHSLSEVGGTLVIVVIDEMSGSKIELAGYRCSNCYLCTGPELGDLCTIGGFYVQVQ